MSDLYRELVLEHWRNPRHAEALVRPTHSAVVDNESCGDSVQVQLQVVKSPLTPLSKRGESPPLQRGIKGDLIIHDISVQVTGCALATAGGSLLTKRIYKQSVADAQSINEPQMLNLLGGIDPVASRRRCATLALEALRDALTT